MGAYELLLADDDPKMKPKGPPEDPEDEDADAEAVTEAEAEAEEEEDELLSSQGHSKAFAAVNITKRVTWTLVMSMVGAGGYESKE